MDMKFKMFICIFVVILIGPNIVQMILRKPLGEKLTKSLINGDYETFYKRIDSRLAKFVISPFNRDYMKLNAAVMQKDRALINEQINTMDNRRLNEKQKFIFYRNVFGYYITENNKQKAKYFLDKLSTLKEKSSYEEAELIYKVEIEKSFEELEKTIQALNRAEGGKREFLLSMIGRMYELKGDETQANDYYSLMKSSQ